MGTIAQKVVGMVGSKDAVAETIEINVGREIINEQLTDSAYVAKISTLLDEIIAARKAKALSYEEYLKKVADLAKRVAAGKSEDSHASLNTPGKRALFNNLSQNEQLALKIDNAV